MRLTRERRTDCDAKRNRVDASRARSEEGVGWAPTTDERRRHAPQIRDLASVRKPFGALVTAVVLGALAGSAEAYPQFQFSTANDRCTACHYSPAGGGLINSYGRFESADTISRWGGSGKFLHGLWDPPTSFQLGGAYRGAFIAKKVWDEPEYLGFPMQADIYGRAAAGDFALAFTAGMRGAAREPRDSVLSRMISREHYVLWQPSGKDWYARVGRFFPVYGLRLADHTAYVRRYLGLHTLEESYGVGVGKVERKWEVHATAFVPPPIWGVSDDTGAAVYYERRLGDAGAWGAQAKVSFSEHESRYLAGGVFKWWLEGPEILLLAELDAGAQRVRAGPVENRGQLAAYLGATWFPTRGVLLSAQLERFDADLGLSETDRDAASLTLQLFPRAHWEAVFMGKLEAQGADYTEPGSLFMFMLHYYL